VSNVLLFENQTQSIGEMKLKLAIVLTLLNSSTMHSDTRCLEINNACDGKLNRSLITIKLDHVRNRDHNSDVT
jgi:hypothetical protein